MKPPSAGVKFDWGDAVTSPLLGEQYGAAGAEKKMEMDLNNPVIKLCIEGTQAEFQGQRERAHAFYQKAWEVAQDEYEACIAAHYLARLQKDPHDKLLWNQVALDKANAVGDQRVAEFFPSLYLNMGQSYELLGKHVEAKRYYDLAAELGGFHQDDEASAGGKSLPAP